MTELNAWAVQRFVELRSDLHRKNGKKSGFIRESMRKSSKTFKRIIIAKRRNMRRILKEPVLTHIKIYDYITSVDKS